MPTIYIERPPLLKSSSSAALWQHISSHWSSSASSLIIYLLNQWGSFDLELPFLLTLHFHQQWSAVWQLLKLCNLVYLSTRLSFTADKSSIFSRQEQAPPLLEQCSTVWLLCRRSFRSISIPLSSSASLIMLLISFVSVSTKLLFTFDNSFFFF